MITFRLADALPSHLLDHLEKTLGRENDANCIDNGFSSEAHLRLKTHQEI
jgi:hypothetical protein